MSWALLASPPPLALPPPPLTSSYSAGAPTHTPTHGHTAAVREVDRSSLCVWGGLVSCVAVTAPVCCSGVSSFAGTWCVCRVCCACAVPVDSSSCLGFCFLMSSAAFASDGSCGCVSDVTKRDSTTLCCLKRQAKSGGVTVFVMKVFNSEVELNLAES